MVWFDVRNDATTPHTVELSGSHGFATAIYDEGGAVINETLNQRRARLRAEFDAYAKRLLDQATAGDAQFEAIRTSALGYRYPTAS
jgi:hypothetical protein